MDQGYQRGPEVSGMSDWLSYQEAAAELGVSLTTLSRRIKAGHIRPIYPPGGHPRITRRELAAYRAAAENRKQPVS